MVFLLTLPRVPTIAHKTWPRPISLNSFQLYALCSLGLIRSRPCCSLSIPNPLLSLCLLCMPENLLHQYLDSSLPHSILTSAQLSLLGELTCFLATQCLLLENVVSLLKFYCVHLFISWDGWASLWSFTWTLYQVDCLSLLHRSLFSGDLLFIFCCCYHLFVWECIPLSPCVYLHVKIAQSCLTLCDSMDGSLPGSFVHRIFQARILEWVAISFSRGLSTSIRWNDNLPQSWRSGLHCSCLVWPRSSISPSHQNQPLTWAVCACCNRAAAAAWGRWGSEC